MKASLQLSVAGHIVYCKEVERARASSAEGATPFASADDTSAELLNAKWVSLGHSLELDAVDWPLPKTLLVMPFTH